MVCPRSCSGYEIKRNLLRIQIIDDPQSEGWRTGRLTSVDGWESQEWGTGRNEIQEVTSKLN